MTIPTQNPEPTASLPEVGEIAWSSRISLWLAAAAVGLITSVAVWLFMKGFELINNLTLGTFGAMPAPIGQISTALIPALGGLIVVLFMHALTRPDTLAAMAVALAVIVLMVLLKRIRWVEKFAAILALVGATIVVYVFNIPIPIVGSIATIPSSLPMLPDFSLAPQLALGSLSVTFVALAQGAAVNTAVPKS